MDYNIESAEILQRLYPYLSQLIQTFPPTITTLEPGREGELQGSRYESGWRPLKVLISPEHATSPTIAHENIHRAIEMSPNWRYMIPPKEYSLLNELTTPSLARLHHWGGYSRTLVPEEAFVRSMVADKPPDKPFQTDAKEMFTKKQQSVLPSLRQFIQYGPEHGAIWGKEEEKGIDIYPAMPPFEKEGWEMDYRVWLRGMESMTGQKYNPNDPNYDYRRAFLMGVEPKYNKKDKTLEWPPIAKRAGHKVLLVPLERLSEILFR